MPYSETHGFSVGLKPLNNSIVSRKTWTKIWHIKIETKFKI